MPAPPSAPASPAETGELPPLPPESPSTQLPWLGLDRSGVIQALGGLILGLILGLIALLTSYDHLSIAGTTIPLPQP